jgi:hypothetical protein
VKQLIINTKIVGRRGPVLAPISVQVSEDCPTVKGLLASIVQKQVDSFRDRQESRRLIQILTEGQIADGLESGRFVSGGEDLQRPVNVDEAIQAAYTAFEDGFFYLFLGNTQFTSLDKQVGLGEVTEALFVRLVPLVGG